MLNLFQKPFVNQTIVDNAVGALPEPTQESDLPAQSPGALVQRQYVPPTQLIIQTDAISTQSAQLGATSNLTQGDGVASGPAAQVSPIINV